MYKLALCLLLIFIQSNKSTAKSYADSLYSIPELIEDINYYITTLTAVHPDLYAYTSKNELNKQIQLIKKKINRPMSRYEFGRIVARLNKNLDGHTGIPLGAFCMDIYWKKLKKYQKEKGLFVPFIEIKGTKAYLNGEEIITINDKKITPIIEDLDSYYTHADSKRFSNWMKTIDFSELKLSFVLYDLNSPFKIVTQNKQNVTKEYIKDGWSEKDYLQYKKQNGYQNHNIINCDFYFEDSIACINWNDSFMKPEIFKNTIDSIFIQISNNQTKYLFINIAQNTGGYPHGYYLLNKIKHLPFNWKYIRKDKISQAYKEHFNIDSNYYQINKNQIIHKKEIRHQNGNSIGFSGTVFIIQGPWTYSNGDDFARLVKASGRCTSIGLPTGQRNLMMSQRLKLEMPNTHLQFDCACKYFMYFNCDDDGLCPDIYYPIGIYKNSFSQNELLQMIQLWTKRKDK